MGKYLKMADVFPVEIRTDDDSGSLICDEDGITLESFSGDKVADYALHAINSHDELVAEVELLTKSAELAIMTLEEVDRVITERIKNGAYDLDDISGEVTYTLDRLSHRE